ncbi:solute carrier family 46 member 3-like, partial [Tropilaelaps mercedesae]
GIIVLMTAVYTNISESCPPDCRKARFLMIHFFMFLPTVAAMAAGGVLYNRIGIFYMAMGSSVVLVLPFFLLLFFCEDVEKFDDAKRDDWRAILRHSTGLRVLKQSFSYLTRPRPCYARAQLYCMFVCLMIGVMGITDATDFNYIYFSHLYQWDVSEYTRINAIATTAVFILSIPNMLLFTKVFRQSDPAMIFVGFTFFALKYFILSLIYLNIGLYYVQLVVGLPFIVAMISIRSHMSCLLASHEVTVVFALASAFEPLVPIAADAARTLIYDASVRYFPGLVYAVQSAVFLIPAFLAILCTLWTRCYSFPEYESLEEEVRDEEKLKKNVHSRDTQRVGYG